MIKLLAKWMGGLWALLGIYVIGSSAWQAIHLPASNAVYGAFGGTLILAMILCVLPGTLIALLASRK